LSVFRISLVQASSLVVTLAVICASHTHTHTHTTSRELTFQNLHYPGEFVGGGSSRVLRICSVGVPHIRCSYGMLSVFCVMILYTHCAQTWNACTFGVFMVCFCVLRYYIVHILCTDIRNACTFGFLMVCFCVLHTQIGLGFRV
jgi:hypothetical protein